MGVLRHKDDTGGKKVYLCILIAAHGSLNYNLFKIILNNTKN